MADTENATPNPTEEQPKPDDVNTDDTTGDEETVDDGDGQDPIIVTEEFVPQHVLDGGRDYRVEGNDTSGYIGVDPEYMTYANETEKPHLTDEERYDYTDQFSHLEGNMDEEETADEETSPSESSENEVTEPSPIGENGTDGGDGGMFLAPKF